jgi:hypothetical protein
LVAAAQSGLEIKLKDLSTREERILSLEECTNWLKQGRS